MSDYIGDELNKWWNVFISKLRNKYMNEQMKERHKHAEIHQKTIKNSQANKWLGKKQNTMDT